MNVKAFLLLGTALVAFAHASPYVDPGSGLRRYINYIGSNQGHVNVNVNNGTSLYLLSEAMLRWTDAQDMCKNALGDQASLLELDSVEEGEYVSQLLRKGHSVVRTSWIEAGPPQSKKQHNIAAGLPKTLIVMGDDGRWLFESREELEPHPFICEFPLDRTGDPVPCSISNELIMSLDSSRIPAAEYNLVKQEYLLPLATQWNQWGDTKLSLNVFATDVLIHINLDRKYDDRELSNLIINAPKLEGATNTHLALNQVLNQFDFQEKFVQRNLVVLTTGQSTSPELTKTAAKMVNEHKPVINVYSVGLGPNVGYDELLAIAGGNERRVFQAHNFQELKNLLKPLSIMMSCVDKGDN